MSSGSGDFERAPGTVLSLDITEIISRYRLLPPDYALTHLKRADIPARLKKPVINGAKLPLVPGTEDFEENEPVRVYLEDRFWGIAARRENELIWKALIAPEEAEETN